MLGHFDTMCGTMKMDQKLELEKRAQDEREKMHGTIYAIIVGDSQRYINEITGYVNGKSNNNNNNVSNVSNISNSNNSN